MTDTTTPRVRRTKGKLPVEAAAASSTGEKRDLAIDDVFASPHNPRRRFDPAKLEELADSIRRQGVLQPILTRPSGAGFEIVAGERRWRAAKLAGKTEIPAIVRDYSDEDVADIRLIENLQRQDLDPLEEADAVAILRRRHDVNEIVARLGRSETWVRQRLRLAAVSSEVRKLVEVGKLGVAGALRIAQLDYEVQRRLAGRLEKYDKAQPLHELERMIERESQRLGLAPWSLSDATLLPEAGACTACPHRSGAQPDIFSEFATDHCLLSNCWQQKLDAHWAQRRAAVVAQGGRVLSGEEAAELVGKSGYSYSHAEWVDLGDVVGHDPDNGNTWRPVEWRKDLPALRDLPITLVETDRGPVELVSTEQLAEVLESAGRSKAAERHRPARRDSEGGRESAAERAQREAANRRYREEQEAQRTAEKRRRAELVEAAADGPDLKVAELVLWQAIENGDIDDQLAAFVGCDGDELVKRIRQGKLRPREVRALAVDYLAAGWNELLERARSLYGLEAQIETECRVCGCSENNPCEGGCQWVSPEEEPDINACMAGRPLCSRCMPGFGDEASA